MLQAAFLLKPLQPRLRGPLPDPLAHFLHGKFMRMDFVEVHHRTIDTAHKFQSFGAFQRFRPESPSSNDILLHYINSMSAFLIGGFGSFSLNRLPARIGHNPKTGESIAVPERNTIRFRSGKELRERVNSQSIELS